jgi:hypothetical protein
MKKELKEGDQYLCVVVTIGDVDFTFAAFRNEDRTTDNKQPHFKGKNLSVWLNKKKAKDEVKTEDII